MPRCFPSSQTPISRTLASRAWLTESGFSRDHQALRNRGASAANRIGEPTLPKGERRQLTVMFCDLVVRRSCRRELDPEDDHELIRRYQDTCAGAIARYHGFIARFMGDGVLAYFGYPRAHENAVERAIRAGLAVVSAVSAQKADTTPLQTRVGIATGLVVVGDLVGEGPSEEWMVAGETPNLAARLQGLAGSRHGRYRRCDPSIGWRVVRLRSVGRAGHQGHRWSHPSLAGSWERAALKPGSRQYGEPD